MAVRIGNRFETTEEFVDGIIVPSRVSPRVVGAFRQVDRAEFAPRDAREHAYSDQIIPLGERSSISQPSLVAQMIGLLSLQGHERVLEIGTATGYQAAVLSRLAAEVVTIEVNPELASRACENLERLGYHNVRVIEGDGSIGFPDGVSYQACIVTAALWDLPPALLEQLAVGGKIVAPIGPDPEQCRLTVFEKISDSEVQRRVYGRCAFVPLMSGKVGGWTEGEIQKAEKLRRQLYREDIQATLRRIWAEVHGDDYERVMPLVLGDLQSIIGDKRLDEGSVLEIIAYILHMPRLHPATSHKTNGSEAPTVRDMDQ